MFLLVPLSSCHLLTFSRFDIAAASGLVLVDSAQKHRFQEVHGIYLFLYLVILRYCVPILFVVIAINLGLAFICSRSPSS